MKQLEDIKACLTGNFISDLEILTKESACLPNTKKGLKLLYDLSEIIINICKENENENKLTIENAKNNQNKYMYFLLNQVTTFMRERFFDDAKNSLDEIISLFLDKKERKINENQKCFQFTNIQEAYIYTSMNKPINVLWEKGNDSWVWFKRGICEKKLKNYDRAILDFKKALVFDPMGFDIYEEIISCQKIIDDLNGLYESIKCEYAVCYTNGQLKNVLNNYGYYFAVTKDFDLAVSCLTISFLYDQSNTNKNRIMDYLQLVKNISGEEYYLTTQEDAVSCLLKKHIPIKVSREIMTGYCDLYQQTLLDKSLKEDDKLKIKKNLIEITGDRIIAEIVETDVKDNKVLYPLTKYNIKFQIPKDWIQCIVCANFDLEDKNLLICFTTGTKKVKVGIHDNKFYGGEKDIIKLINDKYNSVAIIEQLETINLINKICVIPFFISTTTNKYLYYNFVFSGSYLGYVNINVEDDYTNCRKILCNFVCSFKEM